MKVCVIGLGYIGFPTACVLADAGHGVVGVDTNHDLVASLKNGGLHIHGERHLADLARQAVASGRLHFRNLPEASDAFIVAVPTPFIGSGSAHEPESCHETMWSVDEGMHNDCPVADLSYVESAVRSIAPFVRKGNLVIIESTVPPGATATVVCKELDAASGLDSVRDLHVVHAPERVLPGNIVHELTHNDRIVGGVTPEATDAAVKFYKSFVLGDVVGTDSLTAELVKLMENTFRDVNIALANEFALICERLGMNVFEAIQLANRHPRVKYLSPGPGVGGHCIAVDPYFVIQAAPDESKLIRTARRVNTDMPKHVVDMIDEFVAEAGRWGRAVHTIGLLGAAYKANVDDDRESPGLAVARIAEGRGYCVLVHDPHIKRFSELSLEDIVRRSDMLVLTCNHDVYRDELTPSMVDRCAGTDRPLMLDTRGVLGSMWDEAGFMVRRLGVGQPKNV